jgi:hypothetical protein
MDFSKLQQQITDFVRLRDQKTIDAEIKRVITMGGGVPGLANAINNAQQQNLNHQAMQNMMQSQQNMGGAMPMFPPPGQPMGQGIASAGYQLDDDHVTRGILNGFELKDKATYEFAATTAQLLGARIRASWSPNRSPRCTPRAGIVWQLFNHNWMVDVQWVGDATGGSEEQWTARFAELADLISKAREDGDKQYGDEPERPAAPAAALAVQAMLLRSPGSRRVAAISVPEDIALRLALLGVHWEWGNDIDNQRGGFRFSAGGQHIMTSPASTIDKYGWEDTAGALADIIARARGVPIGWMKTTQATMPRVDAAAVIEEDAFRGTK